MAIPIVACGALAFLSVGLLLGIAAVLTAISAGYSAGTRSSQHRQAGRCLG